MDIASQQEKLITAINDHQLSMHVVRDYISAGHTLDFVSPTRHVTPLIAALHHQHADVAASLINNGASKNMPNNEGRTPLHAFMRGNEDLDLLKILIDGETREYINKQDKNGATALHEAVSWYSWREPVMPSFKLIADILLDAGADPDIKRDNGDTPLDYLASGSKNFLVPAANYEWFRDQCETGALLQRAEKTAATAAQAKNDAAMRAVEKLGAKTPLTVRRLRPRGTAP